MGIRGELYSTKVTLENRTYFFNVKENRVGDLYLNIVESKNKDSGGFDRQSVVLFADDLQEFLKGFDDSLRVMEKAVREKKKGAHPEGRPRERADRADREDRDQGRSFKDRGDKPFGKEKSFGVEKRGDREQAPRKPFGEKSHERSDRPRKAFGEKSADRGDRPFKARDEGAFDGRKKFVKKSAHTAGTHGIKGPLHKGRIVKAIRKRELPED